MINLTQTNLILNLVRKEMHNLEQLIMKEKAKPLKEQNIKHTEALSVIYHEYMDISEELGKVVC